MYYGDVVKSFNCIFNCVHAVLNIVKYSVHTSLYNSSDRSGTVLRDSVNCCITILFLAFENGTVIIRMGFLRRSPCVCVT